MRKKSHQERLGHPATRAHDTPSMLNTLPPGKLYHPQTQQCVSLTENAHISLMENQGNMKVRIAQVGKVIDIQTQAEKGTPLLLPRRKPQNPQQTPPL